MPGKLTSYCFTQASPDAEVTLTTYTTGNYFGELALIQNQPRAASAFAVGPVKCAG